MIVVAGGKGTRLYPYTKTTPKSMLLFNEKPFIQYQLELLKRAGFTHVHLCLGELAEPIVDFINSNSFDLNVTIQVDKKPLGTGGAVKKAIQIMNYDYFFVMYGDSYLPINYRDIQHYFFYTSECLGAGGLMTIYKNGDRYGKSNVQYNNNKIIDYNKDNPTDLMKYIDYGLSILSKVTFGFIKHREKFDLSLAHNHLLKLGLKLGTTMLDSFAVNERFYEVGSPQGIADFAQYVERNL